MNNKEKTSIKELTKIVDEIKQEYEEAKQALKETKEEYESLIKAFNKTIPIGFFQ